MRQRSVGTIWVPWSPQGIRGACSTVVEVRCGLAETRGSAEGRIGRAEKGSFVRLKVRCLKFAVPAELSDRKCMVVWVGEGPFERILASLNYYY